MGILEHIKKTKRARESLVLLTEQQRNNVLQTLADALRSENAAILQANAQDLAEMEPSHPLYDRLLLTKDRLHAMATEIENVIALASPLAKQLESKRLQNGLLIEKIAVPLGVVAVIYESRPNVTIDVFSLCFKTGNGCILKGGKEAYHSNLILVQRIQAALVKHQRDPDIVYLLPPSREDTAILLNATGLIDVCIPRGSQALINFVRENAKIPVIETGAGIVHTYFDRLGDLEKGCAIILNAKTRRVSVCNALDCLIIHQDRLSDLSALVQSLQDYQVEIFADPQAYAALEDFYPKPLLFKASPADFGQEFLAYKLAIKTVDSVADAVAHIMKYTSHHSEAIITEDKASADYFIERVDAAAVYVNASTAFTDGGQFGMGAEIGISTQKLHVRGPMGLEALTSYKWVIHGNGQIRI